MADSNNTQDQDKNNQLLEALNKHLLILNSNLKNIDPSHPKQQAVKRSSDGLLRDYFAKHLKKEAEKHEKRGNMNAAQRLKDDLGTHKHNHRRVKDSADRMFSTTKKFADSADGMIHSIQSVLGSFVGGKIVGDLLASGRDMIKTYQRMTDVGQTFGGSMITMGAQAAAAGVPLGEFARQIEHNSNVAAALASSNMSSRTSLGELNKAVRDNIKQYGFFGMAIDEVSDLTGSYAENMRLQGRAADINKDKTALFVGSLANEISAFSAITGKSRKEIERDSSSAMQDASILTSGMSDSQSATTTRAVTAVSSMPGAFGQQLGQMLAQSVGNVGGVYMSELGQTMAKNGLGSLLPVFQNLVDKVKDGSYTDKDAGDTMSQFMAMVSSGPMRDFLNVNQTNNAELKHFVQMVATGKGFDFSKIGKVSEDVKRQDAITTFFNTLDQNLNGLNAAFHGGMFDALSSGKLFGSTAATEKTFKELGLVFKALGQAVGNIISTVFTPENVEAMAAGIGGVVKLFGGVLTAGMTLFSGALGTFNEEVPDIVTTLTSFATSVNNIVKDAWPGFVGGLKVFGGIVKFAGGLFLTTMKAVGGVMTWLDAKAGGWGDLINAGVIAVSAGLTYFALKIPGLIKRMFMRMGSMMFAKATIDAGEVIVNGAKNGASLDGLEGSKKDKAGKGLETAEKKSRRRFRFGKSKEAVEGAAETAEHLAHKGRMARMLSALPGRKGVAGAMAGAAGVAASGAKLPFKLMAGLGKSALGMAKFLPFVGAIPTAISAIMRVKGGDYKGAAVDGLSAVLQGTGVGGPLADILQAGMLARDVVGAVRPGKATGDATGTAPTSAAPGGAGAGHAVRSIAGSLAKGLAIPAAVAAATFAANRLGRGDDDRVAGLQGRYDSLTDSLALDRAQDAGPATGDAYVLGLRKIEEAVKEQTQIMMLMSKQGFDLQRKGNQKQQEAINAAQQH